MECVICKNGQTVNQTVTTTLEQNGKAFVFKDVPARVCENCGEQYFEEETSKRLLGLAQEAAKSGMELTISKYKVA
jgi:YgiT-type zinc finger domain-containing protein